MSMRGRGGNSARLRMYNERILLTQLRRLGQASQKELADATGLTVPTVINIVDQFVGEGLVQPAGRRAGRVGQPSMLYEINPNGVFACGLRVGVGVSDIVLMDFSGTIRGRVSRSMQPRFEDVCSFATETFASFINGEPAAEKRLLGLGIALAHDLWYGTDRNPLPSDIVADWKGRSVAAEFSEQIGKPVFAENETRVAAIAEYLFGEAQDFDNFLYVSIGSHISGALVLGGNVLGGSSGSAATLGAVPVGRGRLAHSGAEGGRLNDRASLDGLIRHLGLHGFTIRAVSDLPDVIDQARSVIQEWIDDCIEALTEGLTAAFAVIDVETVIIDSALPQFLSLEIIERLGRRLAAHAVDELGTPRLRKSALGSDAALFGSAILPINAHFFPVGDGLATGDSSGSDNPVRPKVFFRAPAIGNEKQKKS